MTAALRKNTVDAGFSLIEMMVALGIAALVASVALPSLRSGSTSPGPRIFAAELMALARSQRTRAMTTSTERMLVIDTVRREVVADDGHRLNFPVDVVVTITPATSGRPTPSVAEVRFFPEGAASGVQLTVTGRTDSVALVIDWMTGLAILARGR